MKLMMHDATLDTPRSARFPGAPVSQPLGQEQLELQAMAEPSEGLQIELWKDPKKQPSSAGQPSFNRTMSQFFQFAASSPSLSAPCHQRAEGWVGTGLVSCCAQGRNGT